METKRLGESDLELTRIGLGTWAIGGSWQFGWGRQDDGDSIASIIEAMDSGINWIDTAPAYGCGHSEEVIGRALREISFKPIIATKCGLRWNEKREKVNCLDAESIIAECHESLRRLGVEVVDLYQMHWPVPDGQVEEAWGAMASLVQKGDVRYIGASNYTLDQLERVGRIHPVTSLQPPYSMLNRGVEDELLGYCGEKNMGVVCYSPMQKGLLSGKCSQEYVAQLAEDDHRHIDPNFNGERLKINLELVENLRPIAQRNGFTVAQLAIAWVLRRGEVTAAIVGARRKGQIAETVGAGNVRISDDEIAIIDELLNEHAEKVQS